MKSDERMLLLAFVLSLVVFLGYEYYISKTYPDLRKLPGPTVSGTDTGAQGGTSLPDAASDTSRPGLKADAGRVEPSAVEMAQREETTVITGSHFDITVTNFGGGIRQIHLRGIPTVPNLDTRDVALVDESQPHAFGAIRLPGEESPRAFRTVESTPTQIRYAATARDPKNRDAVFEIERTIGTTPHPYEISVTTVLRHVSGPAIRLSGDSVSTLGWVLTPFPKKAHRSSVDLNEIHVNLGSDIETRREEAPGFLGVGGMFGGSSSTPERQTEWLEGVVRWIALGDRYFTILLVSDTPLHRTFLDMTGPSMGGEAQFGPVSLEPGATRHYESRVYAGPKMPDRLKVYGKDILEVMNFGWFHALGFGMLWLMKVFHDMIPNYGIAIILLTCVIRVVLYPLTYKSYVSMAKLKELAPKMKELQEKHKKNSEKLNKEMWNLYKENKVNPAGGCLPILLQIPVFIAFYSMLQYSIELRGARFLWLTDLAEKDPYYILPVLMGVSMLIQQKMTPSPDPNQAKIGMIMTVVFTFLFLTFPGGLVLYWTVSNVLGIWQQKMIEKKTKPQLAPAT